MYFVFDQRPVYRAYYRSQLDICRGQIVRELSVPEPLFTVSHGTVIIGLRSLPLKTVIELVLYFRQHQLTVIYFAPRDIIHLYRPIVGENIRGYASPVEVITSPPLLTPDAGKNMDLTLSELKILREIVQGYSPAEIARRIYRSIKTISSHKRNMMHKLGTLNNVTFSRVLCLLNERAVS